jgi:hypothetical protein
MQELLEDEMWIVPQRKTGALEKWKKYFLLNFSRPTRLHCPNYATRARSRCHLIDFDILCNRFWLGNRRAVYMHAFKVKLDRLFHQTFGLLERAASGDAPGQIRHIGTAAKTTTYFISTLLASASRVVANNLLPAFISQVSAIPLPSPYLNGFQFCHD